MRLCEAINAQDVEALAGCLADGHAAHGLSAEFGPSTDDYLRWVRAAFEAFPDGHHEALEVVAAEDCVAVRFRYTGTHEAEFLGIPASGRPFELEGGAFCRLDDDGRIAAHWVYADTLGLMRQLGAVPT